MLTLTDMFCGAGGSSTGAIAAPGVEVRVASNHWRLAIETHNTNHPDADHICADLSQTHPRYFPRTDILWASPECFTAGHLVTTYRGQVPIELVEVGDLVLTHERRWRTVTRVQSRKSSQLVLVKGQGHPGIVTTASHRFWARASTLRWHNEIRQYRREYQEPQWARADDLSDANALWATPTTHQPMETADLPPVFRESERGWWLLGRWLGDGSLSFGRNHEVTISCGYHEAEELEGVLCGTGVRWHRSDKRTAAVFTSSCAKSRDWLMNWCGHGAANKQTPPWATSLIESERQAILDGYMSADGGSTQRRHRASTVSRALAISIRMLAESLGNRVAMAYDKRTAYSIEGRSGVAKRQWILHWEPMLSPERSPEAFEWAGMAWSRVRSVTPVAGAEVVYNIEVEEDHSYVIDGIVVKNCTNHSRAKGRPIESSQDALWGDVLPDEAAERSRATMWDVVRFADHHAYRAAIVENVVEVTQWRPFQSWLSAMHSLGYRHQLVSLNSMHAQRYGLPAPQSRDRFYAVFTRVEDPAPDLSDMQRPLAWCDHCGEVVRSRQWWKRDRGPDQVGRYRQQYLYRCPNVRCRHAIVEPAWLPAYTAIDWTIPGQRIGDRTKPLAEKTRARIAAGIARYWHPIHVEAAGHTYDAADPKHPQHGDPNSYYRAWSVADPLKTLHTIESKALAVPVEGRDGKVASPVSAAFRTQTTRLETGLAIPFIAELRGGGSTARSTADALATLTAGGNHHGLVTPYYGTAETARPTTDPLGTLTTHDRFGLVVPAGGTWNDDARPTDDALRSLTTRDAYALVMRNNTGGAEMVTPAWEEMRTITTAGHQSILTPGDIAAARAQVDDVLFRMLEPSEAKRGMAFPTEYVILGTRREQVRMAGNAVTPPAARDLVTTVAATLNGAAA